MNWGIFLYGVNFDLWYPKNIQNENEIWNQYWKSVKENISYGYPVITSVDPLSLPSIRKQFSLPEEVWNNIPPSTHSIIIVGYDEILKLYVIMIRELIILVIQMMDFMLG